ncbi:MAG: protein O-mannosyl-transferase family [Gemmatirosa sp.]
MRGARRAAGVSGAALLLLYVATLAPGVTFWDAGEFAAAFATFGIPHPPGTPLFVALGRAWTWALGLLGVDVAIAANLLSAVCTALAGAIATWLLTRWTRQPVAACVAAICAGATSSVWLSATETEVYAAALLLSWSALAAADGAAVHAARARLTTYALALSVPLHLSALAVTPAAALLGATTPHGERRLRRGGALLLAGVAAAGAGSGRWVLAIGAALAAAALAAWDEAGRASTARLARAIAVVGVLVVAASAVFILLLRARHEPALDQGHPATLAALGDVLARRQYAVAPLWPRQAPWWLQVGNLGVWADWQFALGIDGAIGPSARRTPATLLFVVLGFVGARWHRRHDPRSWRVLAVLLLAASLGVAAYLNLKAGPTYGWGILPAGAIREARERDYFFALAFFTWGLWAGLGAWAFGDALAARLHAAWPRVAGAALALLPIALNWRAADRRRQPDAALPAAYADAVLANAPPRAVLLLNADNDSYPIWFAQMARGHRADVTPVTVSLLGAAWYRGELARRHGLLAPAQVQRWLGTAATIAAIAERARAVGRPMTASLAVGPTARPRGTSWALHGAVLVAMDSAHVFTRIPAGALLARTAQVEVIDYAATRAAAVRAAPWLAAPAREDGDRVTLWAQRQLACAALALIEVGVVADAAPAAPADARVETACRAW